MKKKEAEQLIIILGHEKFLATKCKANTYMALVRNQIAIEPIREEIEKARKIAREKYTTDELKELGNQVQGEGVPDDTKRRYFHLATEFGDNMKDALSPLLDEPADITIEKITPEQFEQIITANEDWMDLNTITILYKYIVTTTKTD